MTTGDFSQEPYLINVYAQADSAYEDIREPDLIFSEQQYAFDQLFATYIVRLPQFAVNGARDPMNKINGFYILKHSELSDGLKEFMAEIQPDDEAVVYPGYYYYNFDYFIKATPRYLSVITHQGQFFGWFHDTNSVVADVFDRKTGDKIKLSDIFKADEETYIYRLCEEIYKAAVNDGEHFLAKSDLGYLEPITTYQEGVDRTYKICADVIRRENFYLDAEGLVILFNEYEIASYSAGPTWVKIPYNCIEDILK